MLPFRCKIRRRTLGTLQRFQLLLLIVPSDHSPGRCLWPALASSAGSASHAIHRAREGNPAPPPFSHSGHTFTCRSRTFAEQIPAALAQTAPLEAVPSLPRLANNRSGRRHIATHPTRLWSNPRPRQDAIGPALGFSGVEQMRSARHFRQATAFTRSSIPKITRTDGNERRLRLVRYCSPHPIGSSACEARCLFLRQFVESQALPIRTPVSGCRPRSAVPACRSMTA